MQHTDIHGLNALPSICWRYCRINAKLGIKIVLTLPLLQDTVAIQSYHETNISGLRENILIHTEAPRKISQKPRHNLLCFAVFLVGLKVQPIQRLLLTAGRARQQGLILGDSHQQGLCLA